jgi:hypothetical protein
MSGMGPSVGHNDDIDWDGFEPDTYYDHNYRTLRADDRRILKRVRDHFSRVAELGLRQSDVRGIDVGTGPNLYPALTMLPFCGEVTLFEHSRTNIKWLEKEQGAGWPSWDVTWKQFWRVLRWRRAYLKIGKSKEAKEALAA